MARAHAIAAVIEDAPDQQSFGLPPSGRVIVQLFGQLGLDGIEQVTIDDRGLLALQDFTLEHHLSVALDHEDSGPLPRQE